jgi:hypothetical protein
VDALRNAYAEFHDPNRALGGLPSTRRVSSTSSDRNSWAAGRLLVVEIPAPVLQNRANLGLCGSVNDLQVIKRTVDLRRILADESDRQRWPVPTNSR